MPLETATFITDLVASNPAHVDGLNNADAHLRVIKGVVQATFPGANAALTRTIGSSVGHLSPSDGVAATPAYAFTSEPGLGLYRVRAGVMGFTGTLQGQGAIPAGTMVDFGGATAPAGWLACDGNALATASYPDLFAAIGYTWGGSGATFYIPNLTSRYRRHRDNSIFSASVGTIQSPAIGVHDHASSATMDVQGYHAHGCSGTTGFMDRANVHNHTGRTAGQLASFPAAGGGIGVWQNGGAQMNITVDNTDTNHLHAFAGATDIQGGHAHNLGITVGVNNGSANETRPYSATVLTIIKT